MTKKLYRSEDKVFGGVLAGLGEYLDIDPTVLRLAFVFIAILTGVVPAIIAYVIACMIVPMKPSYQAKETSYTETTKKAEPMKEQPAPEDKAEEKAETIQM